MDKIKNISQSDANIILDLFDIGKAYLCEGLYIVRSGNIYTAIDNSSGDAFCEDFFSYKEASDWLLNL